MLMTCAAATSCGQRRPDARASPVGSARQLRGDEVGSVRALEDACCRALQRAPHRVGARHPDLCMGSLSGGAASHRQAQHIRPACLHAQKPLGPADGG